MTILAPLSAPASDGSAYMPSGVPVELTPDELEFVKESGPLKVSYSAAWAPFEYVGSNGEFSGIMADIFVRISDFTGLTFVYEPTDVPGGVAADADIISSFEGDMETAVGMGYRLTKPYLSMPMLLVRSPSLDGGGKTPSRTAVPSFYYSYMQVSRTHKDLSFITYDTPEQCIDAVMSGEVDQALINLVLIEHIKQKLRYRDLLTIGMQDVTFKSCIAVRESADPRLLSVLDKALARIPVSDMNGIVAKNTIEMQEVNLRSIVEAMPSDVVMTFGAIMTVIVVILLLLIWNRTKHLREIKRILYTDELTGALSMAGFEKAASQILASDRTKKHFIVDFDISRFENYNSLHGRERGDELLRLIADTMMKYRSSDEFLARIYADHFVIFTANDSTEALRERVASFNSRLIALTASDTSILINYGIFEITDHSMPVREMIDCAVMAKQQVKGNAEDYIAIYDHEVRLRRTEDGALIAGMEAAMKNGEFVVFYQPKFASQTGLITCSEALVRWFRSDGSIVRPDRFIDLFEGNGQIIKLDFYMLEEVCKKQREFAAKGLPLMSIAVNFSRSHLYDSSFVEEMTATIKKYDVPPSLIEIEFTERAMTEDLNVMKGCLQSLRSIGFSIAMDDFGSGYSSLNALKELPIDVVKLDKGFMDFDQEKNNESGRKVVRSVIDLAKQLSLKTVVEGVETKEQFEFLRDCGCDMIQGYYFSKPVDAAEYERLLSEQQKSARR